MVPFFYGHTFSRCFSGLTTRFPAGSKLNSDMLNTSNGSCGRRRGCKNFRRFRGLLTLLCISSAEFIGITFRSVMRLPRLGYAGISPTDHLRWRLCRLSSHPYLTDPEPEISGKIRFCARCVLRLNKHAAQRLRLFRRGLCELLHQPGEARMAAKRVPDGIELKVAVSRLRWQVSARWLFYQAM